MNDLSDEFPEFSRAMKNKKPMPSLCDLLRRSVIFGNSESIKSLLLNKNQLNLLSLIENYEPVTSSMVAGLYGISSQNANSKLMKLKKAGYVTRTLGFAESGGVEYSYTTRVLKS